MIEKNEANKNISITETNLELEFFKAQLDDAKLSIHTYELELNKQCASQEIQTAIQGEIVQIENYNDALAEIKLKNNEIQRIKESRDRLEAENDVMRE